MNARLSLTFSVFIILFSIYSFSYANIDFSYDYSVYLYFSNNAYVLDFSHLNRSLLSNPPYVLLPPSTTLEYGYVFLIKILGSLGLSAAATYTVIGSSSIAIRAYVLSKARAGLFLNILLALSFITLFEANALRAGLASSAILIAMMFFLRQRFACAAVAVAASFLIHIQSVVYIMTFSAGLGIYLVTAYRPYYRIPLIILGTSLTFLAIPIASLLFNTKIEDYMMRASDDDHTTGINIVSILSILVVAMSLRALPKVVRAVSGMYPLTWVASLFAFSQATIFLVFGAAFADIGVRLSQFAFLIMTVAAVFLKSRVSHDDEAAKAFNLVIISIYLCMAAMAINVIFRYPLSNFFYPFVPYVPIEYVNI